MNILWFCIPAHGHTNPTIEVVRQLTARGHVIRYYSFEPFREKIEGAGAQFVPIDAYLPPINDREDRRLRRVSTTEMSVQSFRTTASLDGLLAEAVRSFKPDLVVSDSACFWGKLTAWKHRLPLVCSTTTFAFNRYSSGYLKYSFSEMADMILGLPRLNREAAKLRKLGYPVRSALDIVQDRNDVDTVVYTSRSFQPFGETFDEAHFRFVGPSLRDDTPSPDRGARPLVYISLGTVVNDRPDFYRNCVQALKTLPADGLIACGRDFDIASLGRLPDNLRVEPYVDQLKALSGASLFITHCGMNSASEGLYYDVPELLFPLTGEERAVARRVGEVGAGRILTPAEAASPERLRAAIQTALADRAMAAAAGKVGAELRACGGARAAADFIESRMWSEG